MPRLLTPEEIEARYGSGAYTPGLSMQEARGLKRGVLGATNDYMIEIANAAAGGVGAVADFVSPGNRVSRFIDEEFIRPGEQSQSVPVQMEKRQLARSLSTDDWRTQAGGVMDYVTENPLLAASQAAGSFAPIGLGLKGTQYASQALGLGEKGARWAGRAAGSALSGSMAGGDAAGNAYDLVMRTPWDTVAKSPEAQVLLSKGMSPEEVHEALAESAGRDASYIPAIIGAVSGATGAESALLGGTVRGWRGAGRTIATEFGTEAFEEGVTQYSGQRAAQQYNPEINPNEGVVGAGLLGGILGAGTATPIALMNMAAEPRPAVDTTQNYDLTQRGLKPRPAPATEVPAGEPVSDSGEPPISNTRPPRVLGVPDVSNWTDENLRQTYAMQMAKDQPNQPLLLAVMDEMDLRAETGKSIGMTAPPVPAAPVTQAPTTPPVADTALTTEPTTPPTATPTEATKKSVYSAEEIALMDRSITPTKRKVELFQEAQATGIDLESDLLVPFWTSLAENKYAQAKTNLADAIIKSRNPNGNSVVAPAGAPAAQPGTAGAQTVTTTPPADANPNEYRAVTTPNGRVVYVRTTPQPADQGAVNPVVSSGGTATATGSPAPAPVAGAGLSVPTSNVTQATQAQQAAAQGAPAAPVPAPAAPDQPAAGTPGGAVEATGLVQPISETAPTDVLVQRRRKGKLTLTPAAAPAAAWVAPETSGSPAAPAPAPAVNDVEAALAEADVEALADRATLEKLTGNEGAAAVALSELAGKRQDREDLTDEDREAILTHRFSKSKDGERERRVFDVFGAITKNAPHGFKEAVKRAVGADFGIDHKRVDQIGNPEEIIRAGVELGYSEQQVMDLFGFERSRKKGAIDAAEDDGDIGVDFTAEGAEVDQEVADGNVDENAEELRSDLTEGEDGSYAGGGLTEDGDFEVGSGGSDYEANSLDDDRRWQKASSYGNKKGDVLLKLHESIGALADTMAQMAEDGLGTSANVVAEMIAAQNAKLEEALKKAEKVVEKPKTLATGDVAAARQRWTAAGRDLTKLDTGDLQTLLPYVRDTLKNAELTANIEAELTKREPVAEAAPTTEAKTENLPAVVEPTAPSKPATSRARSTKRTVTGKTLWMKLREQVPTLVPFEELTKNQQGYLNDLANKTGGKFELAKETGLQELVRIAQVDPNVIDGTGLVRVVNEQERKLLGNGLSNLTDKQRQKLESHYGADSSSVEFLTKLREDVTTYITKGAQAVAGAIRSAIKAVAEGVMAVGIIFNPSANLSEFRFNFPEVVAETRDVRATVPAEAEAKMSNLAKSVYEKMAPAAKKSGRAFIIADKPNGMIHAFNADGSAIVQDAALYGKDMGDTLGASSLQGGPKVTPAGKFTMKVSKWDAYVGGYTLDFTESYDGTGYIAVHAAYVGNPAENRLGRIATPTADDNRVSYGCINTSHDTFLRDFLPNIQKFNGGMAFVLPDNEALADTLFQGETETVTRSVESDSAAADNDRSIAAKEERGPVLENIERNNNPFPESVVRQPVYHATQAKFDPADMKSGDIGIHFGDMWQAADRGGLSPERFVFEPIPPFEQGTSRVGFRVEELGESNEIEARQARAQLGKRRMLKFFINLKNPLVMEEPSGGAWHDPAALRDALNKVGVTFPKALDNFIVGYTRSANNITAGLKMPETQRMVLDKMAAHLKSLGYDGIQYTNKFEGKVAERIYGSRAVQRNQTSYIVFDKSQISTPEYDLAYNLDRLSSTRSDTAEAARRSPSLRRELTKLQKMLDKGELTPDAFAARVELAMKMTERERPSNPRQRGADYIRQRLLEAKRRGDLSADAVDFAEWFIMKNPALVDDLAVSIRSGKESGTSGQYEPFYRLMTLMKESNNDETIVHEILHHMERMMPAEMQAAIRKSWAKSLAKAHKAAQKSGDKNLQQFYQHLMDYHLGEGLQSQMKAATDLLREGVVDYNHYQHVNPSEFWAVNGSRIMQGRFGVSDSVLGRIKQWLRELAQKAKAVLGLKSDAPIIRALDSLVKGDGKFQSQTMLMEGADTYADLVEAGSGQLGVADPERAKALGAAVTRASRRYAGVYQANDPAWQVKIASGKPFGPIEHPVFAHYGSEADGVYHMFVFDEGTVQGVVEEIENYNNAAKRAGQSPLAPTQELNVAAYYAAQHMMYDPASGSFSTFGPAQGTIGSEMLEELGALGDAGNGYTRVEGVTSTQLVDALGRFTAYVKTMQQRDTLLVNWERVTGAAAGKKEGATFLNIERPTRSAAPAQVTSTIDRLPPSMRGAARSISKILRNAGNKSVDLVVFTEDLIDRAVTAGVKSAQKYKTIHQARSAMATSLELEVVRIESLYDRVPRNERGTGPNSVNQFLYDSTRERRWGFIPEWRGDVTEKDVDPAMERRYDALSPESKALVQEMFRHGDEMLDMKKNVLLDYTNTEYDALIAAAQEKGDTAKVEQYKRDKKAALKRYETLFDTVASGPYAPLKRFGNFVVMAKSAEYIQAELDGDEGRIRALQANENHYHVSFAESFAGAEALADELRAQGHFDGGEVQAREKQELRNQLYGGANMTSAFFELKDRVNAALDAAASDSEGAKISTEAAKAVHELMTDLFLTSLAETSARKSEIRRRGVSGEIDMLRSFGEQGRADANFVANSRYAQESQDVMRAMWNEATKGSDQARKTQVVNEVRRRYFQTLDYQPTPVADQITRTTSLWFLTTSPAYLMQNLTQPYVFSLPVMAATHGEAKSLEQLWKAFGDMKGMFRSTRLLEQFDLTTLPNKNGEREAMQLLATRGQIDIGLNTEIGQYNVQEDNIASRTWNTVHRSLRSVVQKAESWNRVLTAMAAYRLELERSNGDRKAATEYASKVLRDTHGDYTRFNAPRAFNTSIGKVALQFRKFQLIQATLMVKMLKEALSGTERLAALKALGFMIGHTALIAGLKGLPGASLAFLAYGILMGDDDEPANAEANIRRAMGEEWADLVLKGAPTLLGIDISGKVGMGNTFSILPYTDVDLTTRAGMERTLVGLSGPAGGLVTKFADGLGLLSNGDYMKGFEMLLPTGLANALKGVRFATEGVTRRNGDVLMSPDEINLMESLVAGLGVPLNEQTSRAFKQQVRVQYDQFFQQRSAQLKQKYTKAKRAGEPTAEIVASWNRMQQARVNLGYTKQPLSDLLKAPQEQAKREKNTAGAVQFNRSNEGFVRSLTN